MAKEKFNKTKNEKVKIGAISDPSHCEEALKSLIVQAAINEAKRRNKQSTEVLEENIKGEIVESPKFSRMRKSTKTLLKSKGKFTIESIFSYITPEEVYENYKAEILEFMKKKVGKAFVVESVEQMELGEYSDKARATEFNGKCYNASRVDVKVKDAKSRKSRSIILVFTPFNVTVHGVRKEFSDMGKIDKDLTLVLRDNMKKEFGKAEYEKALKAYTKSVKEFKDKVAKGEASLW